MPTIEIVSIDSGELGLDQADFRVAIIEENTVLSHRGLFYDFLQKKQGVIVHIGDPPFKNDRGGGFFAGSIIEFVNDSLDESFKFRFLETYRTDIDKLLEIALDKSPVKRIFFLTDYQFGPDKERIEAPCTIIDFWIVHDAEGLTFNTLYEMCSE